jgi:hypothetical protein
MRWAQQLQQVNCQVAITTTQAVVVVEHLALQVVLVAQEDLGADKKAILVLMQ